MYYKQVWLVVVLVAVFGLSAAGCGPKFIPGTKIPDTPETKEVLRVVEKYRVAMENRDVDTLISLASPNYFEKNGNNNSRDNYGYEGLVKVLRSYFKEVSKIKLVIIYKDVKFNKDKTRAQVFYHFILNFRKPPEKFEQKVVSQDGEMKVVDNFDEQRWYSKSDDNVMVLEKDKKTGKWLIVRGM